MIPDFISRDSGQPDFWSERFEKQFTPWDQGGVQHLFREFVATSERPLITLIPGCGNAYEAVLLAQMGWDVTAIDFSPLAVQSAHATIGEWAKHVIEADFFQYEPPAPLDLIIERAFFCALPPNRRSDIVHRWGELLPPGALLAGYFFFDDDPAKGKRGPPFSIRQSDFCELMAPWFDLRSDLAVTDSLEIFESRERWMVWQKK